MIGHFRRHAVTPLSAACAGLRRFAAGGPKDIEEVQKELDDFFGTDFAPPVADGSSMPFQNTGSAASSPVEPPAEVAATAPAHRSTDSTASNLTGTSLSHVDEEGRASMVDVAEKADTVRVARASATVRLGPEAYAALHSDSLTKGSAASVLATAELAGTMAAKQTPALIPLCHTLLLTRAAVQAQPDPAAHAVRISAEVRTVGKTGVEMEALTAASVAALTVYDMCKAASKDIVIEAVRLEAKSGGRSGDYLRGGER